MIWLQTETRVSLLTTTSRPVSDANQASRQTGTKTVSHGLKCPEREINNSSPFIARVKNVRTFPSFPLYAFMVWQLSTGQFIYIYIYIWFYKQKNCMPLLFQGTREADLPSMCRKLIQRTIWIHVCVKKGSLLPDLKTTLKLKSPDL
jgi:hypothetical protein